ncbi:putative carboxylesterase family protein [Botrytis fragariae]|uniref:Putative carboxylesterase family protein n=1 Tax=Botrytis fragariae TaxID=1964551 RepID=A0A8H6AW29_9HELO|nr:putative carboxylesterase family protein [Botrytis fragariae]KAF5874677.1 putative carboxylesterase family protein [Botrytis fragariae]
MLLLKIFAFIITSSSVEASGGDHHGRPFPDHLHLPYAPRQLFQDLIPETLLSLDQYTSSHINDGSIGHICPQARPDWTVKEGDPNRGFIGPEFAVYKDGIVILGSKENGSMIVPEGEVRVEEDRWVDQGTRERRKWWGEARYWDGYEGGDENGDGNEDGGNENGGNEDNGNENDGDNNEDDGNEDNDDQDNEDDDTQSSLRVYISHKTIPRPLRNWKNKLSSSQLQNTDSITPTFSHIFKIRNDGKKAEWHAEWISNWMDNSDKAFKDAKGSDNKGKDSEIEEKEELR